MYGIVSYILSMCKLLQSALTVAVEQRTGSLFLTRHMKHSDDLVDDYYYYNFIFFWRLLMVQTQLSRRRRWDELHSLWPIAATRYFNRNKRHHNVLTAMTLTILICSHILCIMQS